MDTVEAFIQANAVTARGTVAVVWLAAAAGALRLARGPLNRSRRTWLVIAVVTLGFALETACRLRFEGTELFRAALRALGGNGAYGNRRALQAVLIAGCVLPLVVFLAVRAARAKTLSRSAKVGALGTGCAAAGFVLETISLHQLDQVPFLYQALRFAGLGMALLGVGAGLIRVRALNRPAAT